MPRTEGIPAYGLHKPTGQARVRIDGKDRYLGPHGSEESKREYEGTVRKRITDRAVAEVRARVEIATDLTIGELVARYSPHAKTYDVKDARRELRTAGLPAGPGPRRPVERTRAASEVRLAGETGRWTHARPG
jgi:hypothetical protein